MGSTRADTLIEQFGKFSPMSVNEAGALANTIFSKNPVSREEAEYLLDAGRLFGANDPGWRHIVSWIVRRHVLQSSSHGELKDGVEDWLIASLSTTQSVDALTLDMVQTIMVDASNATERLGRLGLRAALGCMKAVAHDTAGLRVNTA